MMLQLMQSSLHTLSWHSINWIAQPQRIEEDDASQIAQNLPMWQPAKPTIG